MAPGGGLLDGLGEAPVQPPPAGGLDMPHESLKGGSKLTVEEKNRWLILHISLPRTIMTQDVIDDRDTEQELNDVLAHMAWGTVDEDSREFVIQSEEPTLEAPHESLISYAEYVERKYPVSSGMDESALEDNKKQGKGLLTTFTDNGQPGMKFRPMFDQMVKNVAHSSKPLIKAFGIKKAILKEAEAPASADATEAQNLMRYGRHRVLPSFWQLFLTLVKSGRRFSIVFRSFNEEQLALFREDFTLFTDCKHPAYCGQNKTPKVPPGVKSYVLSDANVGKMHREKGQLIFPNRPAIKPGQPVAADSPAPASSPAPPADGAEGAQEPTAENFEPLAYDFPDYHRVYNGIQHQVLGPVEGNGANVAAIVDDVAYWDAQGRSTEAAKLLLVDHAGTLAETKVQHIFFDGHIKAGNGSAVDVRDVVDGKPISYSETDDVFVHRVDFFKAMIDQDYFVKALEACEQKMNDKVLATRKMCDLLAADMDKPDVMKTLPPKEYLYRAVIPALLPALEACQRIRPADPIEFIAFYMLRHPKQYSKTLKP
eukprot:TRINITY_DN112358_c0_g1_i1.p1 TRINITY_DN112358_c0_g1~~TRINITY_DN112358_c0_g1_i1.p1  ORF type:complete len:540 (-),score=145.37 TRINITY_DN112358_c0_g1_i1:155-1774(-)